MDLKARSLSLVPLLVGLLGEEPAVVRRLWSRKAEVGRSLLAVGYMPLLAQVPVFSFSAPVVPLHPTVVAQSQSMDAHMMMGRGVPAQVGDVASPSLPNPPTYYKHPYKSPSAFRYPEPTSQAVPPSPPTPYSSSHTHHSPSSAPHLTSSFVL